MKQSSRYIYLQSGIILLTGIIAYANSLYAPFQFDDLILSDMARVVARAYSGSARQVVDFSFLANHLVHGTHVFGFHLVNLLIHLGAALTLYALIHTIILALHIGSREEAPELRSIITFIPFASALLFVCHPIQTQAVTYIVQRYTSLATLFYLLSALAFVRARIGSLNGASSLQIVLAGFMSFIAGVLAMRCKEIAFTLPFMLVAIEYYFFEGRLLRNRVFITGIILLLVIIPVQQVLRSGLGGIGDVLYGIEKGTREELTYSRGDYFLTQLRVVVTYLRLLLVPVHQTLDYDYPLQKSLFTLPVLLSLVIHLLMAATSVFLLISSKRQARVTSQQRACFRLASFGILWFYTTLMVESSVIPIVDVIFEHRLYLPSAGFFPCAASVAALCCNGESSRRYLWSSLVIVCLVLTTATVRRNTIWNDQLRLWEENAARSPGKSRVLNNLATILLARHRPDKAAAPLLRAIEIEPGAPENLNNLGVLLDQIPTARGRYDNGRRFLTRANTVDARYITVWFAATRNNLGLVYEYRGQLDKAFKLYDDATSLAPNQEYAWLNLALLASRQGDMNRAAEAINGLKSINPSRARALEISIAAH